MSTEASAYATYPSVRATWDQLALGSERAFRRDAPDYLEERLAALALQSNQIAIGPPDGNAQRFMGSDTTVHTELEMRDAGFVLDDTTPYTYAMQQLPRYRRLAARRWPESDQYSTAVIFSAQHGVDRYFGRIPEGRGGIEARVNMLMPVVQTEKDNASSRPVSVSRLRRIATCADRAAVGNDALHVFGYAPVYEIGHLQLTDEDIVRHAFLVTGDTDGIFVWDPANPVRVLNNSGKLISTRPALYEANALTVDQGHVYIAQGARATYRKKVKIRNRIGQQRVTYITDVAGANLRPL